MSAEARARASQAPAWTEHQGCARWPHGRWPSCTWAQARARRRARGLSQICVVYYSKHVSFYDILQLSESEAKHHEHPTSPAMGPIVWHCVSVARSSPDAGHAAKQGTERASASSSAVGATPNWNLQERVL